MNTSDYFILAIGLVLIRMVFALRRTVKILRIEKEIERNAAVYWFRHYQLKMNPEAYEKLPTYSEMLNDVKPINEEGYPPPQISLD